MPNLFSRSLNWLYGGLGLQEPQVPVSLDVDVVRAHLDVLQGGHALASWALVSVNQTAGLAAQDLDIIAARVQRDECYLVINLFGSHSGGAAAGTVDIKTVDSTSGLKPIWSSLSITNGGGTRSWREWAEGQPYLFIPPGFGLTAGFPATAAGEGYIVRALVGTFRAGFKPI